MNDNDDTLPPIPARDMAAIESAVQVYRDKLIFFYRLAYTQALIDAAKRVEDKR